MLVLRQQALTGSSRLLVRRSLGSVVTSQNESSSDVSDEEIEKHLIRYQHKPNRFEARDYRPPRKNFPPDFRFAFPEFLPVSNYAWRHFICEKLERMDMLRRRLNIEMPEFYVGSVLAVTITNRVAPGKTSRFVGICILRAQHGLRHYFVLRNVVDGLGVEYKYDQYNPLLRKIEVLKLEKRLDDHLRYLRDAPPEYCTFPMNLEPIPHTPGAPVPVNTTVVKLKPFPWSERWEIKKELDGIDEECIKELFTWYRKDLQRLKRIKKLVRLRTVFTPWDRYDLMKQYRDTTVADEQHHIFGEMVKFQRKHAAEKGRRYKIFSYRNQALPDI